MRFHLIAAITSLLILPSSVALGQSLDDEIEQIINNSGTSGNTWGIMFQSGDGMVDFYTQNEDRPLTPASNTKMVTTAGAFGILGPEHEFETQIYYNGTYSNGVLAGDVNLLVEHDITWNTYTLNRSDEALDFLAQQLANQGLSEVQGNINIYGAAYYDRGQFDDVRFAAPFYDNLTVAQVFRTSLQEAGVTVSGAGVAMSTFSAPGDLVYTHRSGDVLMNNLEATHSGLDEMPLTLRAACIELNRTSHNAMADALLFHIGYKASGTSSLAAGASAVLDWFENEAGIDTAGMVMGDGSGLARGTNPPGNEFSARFFVELTRYMVENYAGWDTTLAINCEDGTIGSRMCTPSSLVGRVHAKTGTLFTTIALSGYIDHPVYEERMYFSMLSNNSGGINSTSTRGAMDDIVRAIADGIPPVPPALAHVDGTASGMDVHMANHGIGVDSFTLVYTPSEGSQQQTTVSPVTPYIIQTRSGQMNFADYSEVSGVWEDTSADTDAGGTTPGGGRWAVPHDTGGPDVARFTPSTLPAGRYRIDVSTYGQFLSDNAHNITVRFNDRQGIRERSYDMSFETTGDVWAPVGYVDYQLDAGHYVEFSNETQANVTNSTLNSRMVMSAVRFVPVATKASVTGLVAGTPVDVYATATRSGTTSDHEVEYRAIPGQARWKVLLVDGNDRFLTPSQNPDNLYHDFLTLLGDGLTGIQLDSADNEAVELNIVSLNDYDVVVYLLGEESTDHETFSDREQELVAEYMENGGKLIVSGAEVGWDLDAQGDPSDLDFLTNVLKVDYIADDTTSPSDGIDVVPGQIYESLELIDYFGGAMDIGFPDAIEGINGTEVALYYDSTTEGAAVVGPNSIHFGFPITMIRLDSVRNDLLRISLEHLLQGSDPDSWVLY